MDAVGLLCRPVREIAAVLQHISVLPYMLPLLVSSPVFNSMAFVSLLIRIEMQTYLAQ